MRRTNELNTLLQKLYEDYALGRLPDRAGRGSDCAAVLQGGGTDRQAALQVGVQIRFLLVPGAGQTAVQYHLQRRI